MSTEPEAKLFYGYIKPKNDDDADYDEDDEDNEEQDEDAWSKAHTETACDCTVGLYGYDENLGYFLAVEESLHTAMWAEVVPLKTEDFEVKPAWDESLRLAAEEFGIDLTGLQPGWHLVCLYF